MTLTFQPTRAAGLEALRDFLPHAGRDYTSRRNYDRGDLGHPGVSKLSPYIRHRLVTEEEVLTSVLDRFSLSSAEKYVQEVFWRTYWKGWLELRPSVWLAYRTGLNAQWNRVQTEGGLRKAWEQACEGATGIAPFDAWANELVETGYLHNHARMWFASIWIFTLRLPWELGADFFMRHLLDGDAASNTLSWRWVAGLQTQGKNYVARSSNISKYTEGRFGGVHGLAQDPAPLEGPPHPPKGLPPAQESWDRSSATALLLTEDDLSPGWLLSQGLAPRGVAVLLGTAHRSPLIVSTRVTEFAEDAASDALGRLTGDGPVTSDTSLISNWARNLGVDQVVVPYAPVGPGQMALDGLRAELQSNGIRLVQPIRAYDEMCWPHATAGFFKFKANIPALVGRLKGLTAA